MFASFWMAGFESACHINPKGERLDMIAGVEHDKRVASDYALVRDLGFRTARDGVRWHLVEKAGDYDFSSFLPMAEAGLKQRVQVIWTLCHYGWPDGLDVLSPAFVDRFAKFCGAVARVIRELSDDVPMYTPINEMSFLAWGAERDLIYPFAIGKGGDLKRQFVRATIAACEQIWSVDSRARFVFAEPSIHVVPPAGKPDLAVPAQAHNEAQYEAWDMLTGRLSPDLGGNPKYLDVAGMNYYHSNEWEYNDGRLRWEDEPRDSRWLPFRYLVRDVWERYRRPLIVSETSHFGAGRARWIREMAREVFSAIEMGLPVGGICLYPILDRYDWNDSTHWHNSGLFDFHRDASGGLERVLNSEYAEAVVEAQSLLRLVGKE